MRSVSNVICDRNTPTETRASGHRRGLGPVNVGNSARSMDDGEEKAEEPPPPTLPSSVIGDPVQAMLAKDAVVLVWSAGTGAQTDSRTDVR